MFLCPAPALAYVPGPDLLLCVPKVFLTSGELGTDEIMIESDVGLIRLIVLAALSSSALNGQKILCDHSCVLKYRTRESRTGMHATGP